MSELRDGLETVEQAIYESLGLALPGAVALAGGACVVEPTSLPALLGFATAHPWIALGVCYLTGYPVQSLSRPIDKLTLAPVVLGIRAIRRFAPAAADRITSEWTRAGKWLQRGHRPEREEGSADERTLARLSDIEHACWANRLDLRADQRLDGFDVKNLSFSTLGAEQRRLHRFRAITSLTRAMASIAAVAMWLTIFLLLRAGINTAGAAIFLLCAVLFLAFRERANMYDGLWNGIITPQFLASSARAVAPGISPAGATKSTTTFQSPPVISPTESSPDPLHEPITSDAQGSAADPERRDLRT